MSTNYYFRNKQMHKQSVEINHKVELKIQEIIEEIKTLVDDEDELERIKRNLEDHAEVGYEEIHIGKRSMGWKPTFERQDQFSSVRELEAFYQTNKDTYEIVNEYGEVFDWDGLVSELITWDQNGKENLYDSYKDKDGHIWHYYEYS